MRKYGSPWIDKQLPVRYRFFIYLPFEHSENLEDQNQSIALYESDIKDAPDDPAPPLFLNFAQSHRDDIVKFGRFPYRNKVLGRVSTPEELEFLKEK